MLRVAAPRFRERGYQMDILCTGDCLGTYGPALEEAGFALYHLPFRKTPRFLANYLMLLRHNKYHIVHIHTERANVIYGLGAVIVGVPVVVRTIHSVFPFTGPCRWKRVAQRYLLRKLGVVHVSVSDSVREVERSWLKNPTRTIQNWIDSEKYRPPTSWERHEARARLGVEDDTFVIISVGNCARVKNHSAIIEALSLIGDQKDILYVHVGDQGGDTTERALAAHLGVSDRVRFVGYQADPLPFLWASDLFIMPSLHEGQGVAAVEAIAAGVPAVLADVPGLRDLRPITPATWVAPTADGVAESIKAALLASESACREGALRASQAVRRAFDPETAIEQYHEIYRRRRSGRCPHRPGQQ